VPELPEVETVRRGLEIQTQGMTIAKVEVLRTRAVAFPPDPMLFCLALRDSRIEQWRRRGKYLIARLSDGQGGEAGHWGVHLRMTGHFLWVPANPAAPLAEDATTANKAQLDPRLHEPGLHTRVRIWSAAGGELRFIDTRSFAEMWWVPPDQPLESVITGLKRLGPEPFDAAFSVEYISNILRGSSRPIKSALLDQSLVAGVGNIYADESLFAAGINPHTPSGRLCREALQTLRDCLIEVLQASIGAGGTSFSDFRDLTGTNGNYGGEASVYRRTGQPCRRCGGLIQRDRLSGRSTHWCPGCQR
jgi:formamidopyrimidine-DNA glycosylase